MKRTLMIIGITIAVAHACFGAEAVTETFQKGLFAEEVSRDLPAAIEAYKTVLTQLDEQRRLAATAAFRLAEAYRKTGSTNDAAMHYERVVRDFSDHARLVELSRKALAELGRSAAPPARTRSDGPMLMTVPLPDEQQQEIERLKLVIKNSPDLINARSGGGGKAPLHEAAAKGQLDVVRFLLANNADVNVRDDRGNTSLHDASNHGHKAVAELLIANGADVNLQHDGGETPLHRAAIKGFEALSQLLIDRGAQVNARTREGTTPLHFAVDSRNTRMVELLLANKADVNAQDSSGNTPLVRAASRGRLEMLELLLKHNADVNAKTKEGHTALTLAVLARNEPTTKMLLKHGADPDVHAFHASPAPGSGSTIGYSGGTPLHFAVQHGNVDLIEQLVAAKANINAQTDAGLTPLHFAVAKSDAALVKLLLEKGADANARAADGDTPLHIAANRTAKEIVEILLKNGADPELENHAGLTPAERLSKGTVGLSEREVIELLRKHGSTQP